MLEAHFCSEKVHIGIVSKISNHRNARATAERNKNSSKTNSLLLHCSIIWNFKLSLDHSTGILKLWKIYWLWDHWWICYISENQTWTNVYNMRQTIYNFIFQNCSCPQCDMCSMAWHGQACWSVFLQLSNILESKQLVLCSLGSMSPWNPVFYRNIFSHYF